MIVSKIILHNYDGSALVNQYVSHAVNGIHIGNINIPSRRQYVLRKNVFLIFSSFHKKIRTMYRTPVVDKWF